MTCELYLLKCGKSFKVDSITKTGQATVDELMRWKFSASLDELVKQKSRIAEDPVGYYRVRDRMMTKSSGNRSRAGDKFDEIFNSLDLVTGKNFEFLDLCGAPGAFSLYIKDRFPESSGVGISLKCEIDWWPEVKDRIEVIYGADGTGDLYVEANRHSLASLRKDLVVADGGFSVAGKEASQELECARLILAELSVGLRVLKQGGSLVCKIFDCFSELTASYLCCLTQVFDKLYIAKPSQSRSVNSERYLVGVHFLGDSINLVPVLEQAIAAMSGGEGVRKIDAPITEDHRFMEDFRGMVLDLAARETRALAKVLDERDKKKKFRRS